MKQTRHLACALPLLLALAAYGCAGSSAPDEQQNDGGKTDAQHDVNQQQDGGLPQDDAAPQQDGGQQHDGAPQHDGAAQQDGQHDGAAQQDAGADGTAQQDAQQDGSVTLRTVTGTSVAHHLWDDGSADVPDDLSSSDIGAFVPSGSSYTVIWGTGDATGHFTIADVPTGAYFLYVDGWFFRMTTDTPNLDYYVRGRAGIVKTTSTTNLVFNVTNMSAYQSNADDVIYYSSNTDAYDGIAWAGTQPTAGATTLSKTYDLNAANASQVLATTADHPILIDYVAAVAGAGSAATAARSFSPTPYDQANGAPVNVSGAFAPIGTSDTTAVSWYRSEFHGGTVIADIAPSATFYGEYLTLSAQPGGLTHGAYCSGVDLAQLWAGTGTTDVDFGNVTYGNPFDSTWGQHLFTVMLASATVTASGASALTYYGWTRSWQARASSMPSHLIISPPRSLQVNGLAANVTRTGVGTTPTLSWTAPQTGTASTYQVFVYEVSNSAGSTARAGVAGFYTDQTSVVIPSGALTAGKSYQFRVMAISDPNANYATTPWQGALPYGDATAFTALIAP